MIQSAIVRDVRVGDALITFVLADGREVSAPTSWSVRLRSATQSQRDHFEIEPEGLIVEWPDLDEHVGAWSLLGVSEEDATAARDDSETTSRSTPVTAGCTVGAQTA